MSTPSVLPPNPAAWLRSALRRFARALRRITRLLARGLCKLARLLSRGSRRTLRRVRARLRSAAHHVAWLLRHCPLPLPWFPVMRRNDQMTQLFRLAAQHDLRNRSALRGVRFFSVFGPLAAHLRCAGPALRLEVPHFGSTRIRNLHWMSTLSVLAISGSPRHRA